MRRPRPTTLLSVAVLLLAGVAGTADASSPPADAPTVGVPTIDDALVDLAPIPDDTEVEISFESYNFTSNAGGAEAMNQLVDEFEAAHPNIHVERRVPAGVDTGSSLQQQVVAGDPPSLVQSGFQHDFVANQLGVASWDSIIGADGVDALFDGSLTGEHPVHPNAAVLGDYDGETYLLPFVFSTPTLFFNRTLFEESGLDPDAPPATWDEVRTAAEAIIAETDADGVFQQCTGEVSFGWCYQGVLRSNGNDPISADLTTLDFAGPEAVEVAELFAGFVADGIHPDTSDGEAIERFFRGELGMVLTTSAYTGAILDSAEANAWEMDATGMPAFGDQPVVPTNSGSGLITFATDPLEQRAVLELAGFLTSDHAYTVITSQIGYLPLRTGIVDEPDLLGPWLAEHQFLQNNLDQLDQLHPWLYPPGTEGAQINTLWMDAVNEVIYGGSDATETLAAAQESADALMP